MLRIISRLRLNTRRIELIRPSAFTRDRYLWLKSSPLSSEPEAKRDPEHTVKTIGTHSGKFSCDEVLACYMLKLLPEYKDARILRTRDPALLRECDVVVDVGEEYDPTTHRYDVPRALTCSMSSLTGGRKRWKTKMSCAGLIYFHFGRRVISTITGLDPAEDEASLEDIYDEIYDYFIEEVDASDYGFPTRYCGTTITRSTTNIVQRVSRLNPEWNAPANKTADDSFQFAMQLVGREFSERVMDYKDVWLPARTIVQRALESRFQVDESGEIISLESCCPWKRHLFDLRKKLSLPKFCVKFVIFKEDTWFVQAVPFKIHPNMHKVSLPYRWRGLENDELSKVTGIPGCTYVHEGGYIGGNRTYEGALEMAKKALSILNLTME